MKGLLLKDILNFKNQQGKTFVFLIALYFLLALQMKSSSFFAGLWVMLGATLPISSIAYDEKAKWEKYALTMPITRKELVTSKYVLSFLFIILGNLLSLPFIYLIDKKLDTENLLTALVLMAMGILFNSIMLPFTFRFGSENTRVIMILVVAIPFLIVYILQKLDINIVLYMEKHETLIGLTAGAATLVICFISYLLSIWIMKRKEIA